MSFHLHDRRAFAQLDDRCHKQNSDGCCEAPIPLLVAEALTVTTEGAVAGAVVLGAASAATAQPVPGSAQPTSKKIIKMKGENFAPVVS